MNKIDLSGLILAGGKSRRFGSNKADYTIGGVSMIEHACSTLASVTTSIMISVGEEVQRYDVPATLVQDVFKNAGPLAGLHAGLLASSTSWVLVMAVDLPFVDEQTLNLLIDSILPDLDAVVATDGKRVQPLLGCYRTNLVKKLEIQIRNKKLSATQFATAIKSCLIQVPASKLLNINTLDDATTIGHFKQISGKQE